VGVLPFIAMGSLFVVVDLLALLLAVPFSDAGLFAFNDSENPLDIVYFIAMMLITSGMILVLARFRDGKIVRWVLTGTIWFSIFSTLYLLVLFLIGDPFATGISLTSSIALVAALVRWRRWYLIDAAAILLGAVSTTVLGISLSPLLVSVLLVGLAVYDAIAVYRTGHMLTLAEAILNSSLPLMVVVPKGGDYEALKEIKIQKGEPPSSDKRKAFYMGLGDLVLPGCLVVSVYSTIDTVGLYIAFSIIIGTLIGFIFLSTFVAKGKPQAGLPFLCGGAILGYIISSQLFLGHFVV
jgi:presenilin-like A22 family membrane protease